MNEQELDRLMRQIAEDAALDDSTTNEIADSPALWWNVQREVRNAAPEKAPWPPNYLRKWFMIAAPVAAVVVIALGFYVNSLRSPSNDVASDSGSGSTPSTALSSIQPAEPSNAPVTAAVNTVATTQH